jgi:hypothetical protein
MGQNGNYLSELWDTAKSDDSFIYDIGDMFHDSKLPFLITYDTDYPGLRQDVGIYRPEQKPQGSERLIVNRLIFSEKEIEEAKKLEANVIDEIRRKHKGNLPNFAFLKNKETIRVEEARTVKPIRALFYFLSGPEEGFLAYAIDLNGHELSDFMNRTSQPRRRRWSIKTTGEMTPTNKIHILEDFYKRELITKDEAKYLKAILEQSLWDHYRYSTDAGEGF